MTPLCRIALIFAAAALLLSVVLLYARYRLLRALQRLVCGATGSLGRVFLFSEAARLLDRVSASAHPTVLPDDALAAALEERNDELNRAYIRMEQQNRRMLDSLQYAGLIQRSILPKPVEFADYLSSHFIYWKPRDTVGGDFYWFYRNRDYCLIAVGDCTGHGVPGAFMTMTVNSILNHIVEYRDDNPAEILVELNSILRSTLHHDGTRSLTDDGLDIGICFYRLGNREITFAGAKLSLFIQNGHDISRYRGDRQGIGYVRSREEYCYTNHAVPLFQETVCYLSSDGLFDQTGGKRGLPFGYTRFCRFLSDHAQSGIEERQSLLDRTLKSYMGSLEQLDDICVWGFQFHHSRMDPAMLPGDSKVPGQR